MTEIVQQRRPRHKTASLIVLSIDVTALLSLIFLTTVVLPKFRQIFDDLLEGRAMPALTRGILSVPRPVYALCLVALMAGLILKEERVSDKNITLVVNVVILVLAVLVHAVVIFSLFIPLEGFIGTLEKVSK